LGLSESNFTGNVALMVCGPIDFAATVQKLKNWPVKRKTLMLLGTAISFVHRWIIWRSKTFTISMPGKSRVWKTGG